MTVYQKMVQAAEKNCGWCEYEDGHLDVKIIYSTNGKEHWAKILVRGADDTAFEIVSQNVSSLKEVNEIINGYLIIYHQMPKYVSMEWLWEMGFEMG